MKRILLMITVLVTLISCNQAHKQEIKDDPVVAEWRGGRITLSEYEEFLPYYAFHEDTILASLSTFDMRRDILNDMIKFELIKILADSLQLDTVKTISESYRRRLTAVTYSHFLYPDSVRRKAFPDSEIRRVYNEMKNEGQNLRTFNLERGRIISYLRDLNKEKYNKALHDFHNFLFNTYGVSVHRDRIAEFVYMFNDLLQENIETQSGFYRFNDDLVLAEYNDIVIRVNDLLRYFSKIDKNAHPAISVSDINSFLVGRFYHDLIGAAADDLGYTKKDEVLKIVNDGMKLEYYEHLTLDIFTQKDKLEEWKEILFRDYSVKTHHDILERSFYSYSPRISK